MFIFGVLSPRFDMFHSVYKYRKMKHGSLFFVYCSKFSILSYSNKTEYNIWPENELLEKIDSKKENLNMLSLVPETELTWKCSWKTKQSKQSHFSLVTSESCQSGFHLHIICRLKEGDIPTPVCLPTLGMHLNVLPRALVMPQKQILVVLFTPLPVQSNSLLKNINPFRHMPNLHAEVCPSSFSIRLTPTLKL